MKQAEPPLCASIVFVVGKNSRGHWVAQERNGLYGGLFISRAAAVSYALFENGHNPAGIISTSDIVELRISDRQPRLIPTPTADDAPAVQRAA